MEKILHWVKTHWITSILLGIVAVIVGYFIYGTILLMLIGYIDSRSYDIDYDKLPQPLSTRGLPLPETDIPVILPLDPGEAGKQTLAGIDSNNDGVRDDLEREIVYMYPENEEVRRVLRAMMKTGQDVMLTEGDHEHFERLMVRYFDFKQCYLYLAFGAVNPDRDYTNNRMLWGMIQNTTERKNRFEENEIKGRPYISSATPSCDSVIGQY